MLRSPSRKTKARWRSRAGRFEGIGEPSLSRGEDGGMPESGGASLFKSDTCEPPCGPLFRRGILASLPARRIPQMSDFSGRFAFDFAPALSY